MSGINAALKTLFHQEPIILWSCAIGGLGAATLKVWDAFVLGSARRGLTIWHRLSSLGAWRANDLLTTAIYALIPCGCVVIILKLWESLW